MTINATRLIAAGAALCLLTSAVPAWAGSTSRVDGVWLTDGYGLVTEVADGHAQSYEITRISCVKGLDSAQTGPDRFANKDFEFTLRADRRGQRATQQIDSSVGERHLRRLPALPAQCRRPAPTDRLTAFDVFWTTFAENYPFFAAKNVDWLAVRDQYRPKVSQDTTDDQFFDVLAAMVRPLGDAHVMLRGGERSFVALRPGTTLPTPDEEREVRSFIVRRDLGGTPLREFGRGRIGYAELPGRIGYLRLIAFTGYTGKGFAADAAELDRALDAVLPTGKTTGPRALRGLIIDVRINGGGDDPLGVQIARRLTGRPYLAYTKQVRNDSRRQPLWVHPGPAVYTGPVAVLTGGSTFSAGETFAQALIGRTPSPVRIGENTQGVFSDKLERTLPNGWSFTLPNEEYLTRTGGTFDGTGIPPHVRTPVFTREEFAADRDSAFDRAVTLLR
ncbi:S41 family peptidase [Kibdelosporangium phytohabitans]|uniref:Tail specific protease domain-containing protein n=1 Tax=Kibdelosporangium phytohabitans TaxID=860235 RepID=A0A0N9IA63_9PSEU|nr:S41 family peptidase [Kibdelosporangium phytohabitans]ALG11950.1 hypothetical protein AOZ06_38315 [Kibdelosporangium phytohabitans]MBE1463406.1 hypothetical protein [Kibdelosporangium phytohabitans]